MARCLVVEGIEFTLSVLCEGDGDPRERFLGLLRGEGEDRIRARSFLGRRGACCDGKSGEVEIAGIWGEGGGVGERMGESCRGWFGPELTMS
jgi:hypothetical protein